jgi:hypothetical protein
MLATILTATGVLIAFISLLISRKKEQPELTIEFKKTGGSSSNRGISNKSKPNEEGVYEMRDAILILDLSYDIEIIIRNNSEVTAYYPKILFQNNQSQFVRIDKLNELEPILSKESKTLNAVYKEIEEKKGSERTDTRFFPENLKDIQILLEYKNSKKKTFYTAYKQADKSNTFLKKKPKIFNKKG